MLMGQEVGSLLHMKPLASAMLLFSRSRVHPQRTFFNSCMKASMSGVAGFRGSERVPSTSNSARILARVIF